MAESSDISGKTAEQICVDFKTVFNTAALSVNLAVPNFGGNLPNNWDISQ